jgi:hypothetical protein
MQAPEGKGTLRAGGPPWSQAERWGPIEMDPGARSMASRDCVVLPVRGGLTE